MITRGDIGRRIWIYQIIKRTSDSTDNNIYTKLFKCYRVGIKNKTLEKPVFMRLFGGLLFVRGLNVGSFLYFLMFLKVSRALSFSSDASICCLLGYKCEYVFSVVSMFSWPRRSEINKISIPISTHSDACE